MHVEQVNCTYATNSWMLIQLKEVAIVKKAKSIRNVQFLFSLYFKLNIFTCVFKGIVFDDAVYA